MSEHKTPPFGVRVNREVTQRTTKSGETRYPARARWTDPRTGKRVQVKDTFDSIDAANEWFDTLEQTARTGIDRTQTLEAYIELLGERWARSIDPTSTYDPYSAGLRKRVIPALGHIPVGMITTGLIDRAIDQWEATFGTSTVKNTVAALVLILDEAVRDNLLDRNPAKNRARRKTTGRTETPTEVMNPRDFALPDVATLHRLVDALVEAGGHQSWGDTVTVLATTAVRISECAGLTVGDVVYDDGLIWVKRQTYPGRGGLITKETKGRRKRPVPIIEQLRPTLERLTEGREPEERLILGPRGGVITTASLRRATGWDAVVGKLGLAGLDRHALRHTALTWMADSDVPLHMLQRVAGHTDPAVTQRYLHPDHQALAAVGDAFSTWWAQNGPTDQPTGNVVNLADRRKKRP